MERDCDCCGEPIPARRLEIVPSTKYCVDCLNSGLVQDDTFAKRGTVVPDEEGNIHVQVISSKKEWENLERDKKESAAAAQELSGRKKK